MEVTLVNVCQQRLFLSKLLVAVVQAPPAVVVIDKVFSADSCPNQTEGTNALQHAVQQLLSRRIPVIVGIDADANDQLLPSLDFPPGINGKTVMTASILLEEDVRRAVFTWEHLRDASGSQTRLNTLSFAAAVALRPRLLDVNPRLHRFYAGEDPPFVAFLPRNAFDPFTFSAIKLLCGAQAGSKTDWRTCNSPNAAAIGELSNRVVVIGEDTLGVDQHEAVVGSVPGVWLHANYIEAILNDDLFRPVPNWVGVAFGFGVFLIVEVVLALGPKPWRSLLAVAVVVLAYALCYLLVELTGFYLNPSLGLISLVFGLLGSGVRRWLMPHE